MSRSPNRPTRLLGVATLALALLATACGDDGTDAGATGSAPAGEAVTIDHAGGETTLESVPERVVILDDAMLGDVLAFGVVPVGTAAGAEDPTVIEVWKEEAGVEEIPLVAPDFTPNLESIAAQRPDLILAMAYQVDEPYWDDLNDIAPTIAVETDVNPEALEPRFDEVAMRTYAAAFRQPEVVDELLEGYERRVAEIREEHADVIDGTTISFAMSDEPGSTRLDGPTGWGGAILADLGFTFPDEQLEAIEGNTDFPVRHVFSDEQTERFLSTDVVLWRDLGRDDLAVEDGFPEADLSSNPLLARLPAAEAGQVVTVANRVWFLRSLQGRDVVLDQLEEEILPRLRG